VKGVFWGGVEEKKGLLREKRGLSCCGGKKMAGGGRHGVAARRSFDFIISVYIIAGAIFGWRFFGGSTATTRK